MIRADCLPHRFMEVVLPCDDLYSRSVVTQRASYDCPTYESLKFTIEKQLALLLTKEIEYHKMVEISKYELRRLFDWSDLKAFNTVDSHRMGFLDFHNVMNFCRLNGYSASESEVIAIVRRLDVDAD